MSVTENRRQLKEAYETVHAVLRAAAAACLATGLRPDEIAECLFYVAVGIERPVPIPQTSRTNAERHAVYKHAREEQGKSMPIAAMISFDSVVQTRESQAKAQQLVRDAMGQL